MDCNNVADLAVAFLFGVLLVYMVVRDFIYRHEEAERRELWALRDRYDPGRTEEERARARLMELERKYKNG